MSNYDPFSPQRRGLDEEDATALGLEDADPETTLTMDARNDPGGDVTYNAMIASDEAEPYIAPMDPPVVPGGPDGIRVADGFAASDEDLESRQGTPGDDEITQRVAHLLRTDSATSTLDLSVETIDRVVYLRGTVQSTDDAEQATEVASRVNGVDDVVDTTVVQH